MIKMTEEQKEKVMLNGREIMDSLSEGKSARDVMAELYVNNLDNKTLNQGYVMADAIFEQVKKFDSDYSEAQNDIDNFLNRFQKNVDEGKSPAERCTYWLRFASIISAAGVMADNEEAIDAEHIEEIVVTDEEATPEYEKELHEKAIEAIKNSGVLLTGLIEHAESLKEMENSTEAASFIIDIGARETEYRAIVAMLVYTNAKNGTFDNIPAEATIEQITTLTCTEIEQVKIMNEVGTGNMTEKVATTLLQILGAIAIVEMSIAIFELSVVAVTIMFGAIIAIPAVLVLLFAICRLAGNEIEEWAKSSEKIVRISSCAIKSIAKGAVAIANFLYENVIKKSVEACKKIFKALKNAIVEASDGKAVAKTLPVVAQ